MSANKVAQDFIKAINTQKQKPSAYDTKGEVMRITEGIAWVHLAGGIDETPCELTIGASVGDIVQVRVAGGRAWLVGNSTEPPVGDKHVQNIIKKEKKNIVKDVEEDTTTIINQKIENIAATDEHYIIIKDVDDGDSRETVIDIPISTICKTSQSKYYSQYNAYITSNTSGSGVCVFTIIFDMLRAPINIELKYMIGDAGAELNPSRGWVKNFDPNTDTYLDAVIAHADKTNPKTGFKYFSTRQLAEEAIAQYAPTPNWLKNDKFKLEFWGGPHDISGEGGAGWSVGGDGWQISEHGQLLTGISGARKEVEYSAEDTIFPSNATILRFTCKEQLKI